MTGTPADADAHLPDAAGAASRESFWEERSRRVVLEMLSVRVAARTGFNPLNLELFADPEMPDDDDPDAPPRRFYVDADELVHGADGQVLGVRRCRFQLDLHRVGPLDDTPAD